MRYCQEQEALPYRKRHGLLRGKGEAWARRAGQRVDPDLAATREIQRQRENRAWGKAKDGATTVLAGR